MLRLAPCVLLLLPALCALAAAAVAANAKPNILFILTDDQDVVLGSLDVMPKLKKLVTDQGAYFQNGFANTPICCPSRAEIQTGRYMHNTKVDNNGCGGTAWQQGPELLNLASFLHNDSYETYYSGKYLNNYGSPSVGGCSHIPTGWTDWHALVGNSKYYNYDVCESNHSKQHHGSDYATDYYTDKLKNDSNTYLAHQWTQENPFFMMIGTPCPHVPNIFAPQYADLYTNVTAPRTPNWNVAPASVTGPKAKHWFLQQIGPMDTEHITNSDLTFQDRWRCLQSVDDLVEELLGTLASLGQLDNTYIIFSADHGQHLGQWGMGFDKRNLYETDIRVPVLARGPGIAAGQNISGLVSHIDLAVTILDMAGIPKPPVMDGHSWLPLIKGTEADTHKAAAGWRHDFLIEYNGPTVDLNSLEFTRGEWSDFVEDKVSISTPQRPEQEWPCGVNHSCAGITLCGGEHETCPCDAKNNTYKCLRTINATQNSIYCVFNDDVRFVEYYDLGADPYELVNLHETGDPVKMRWLHDRLHDFMLCSGDNCFDPPPNIKPPPAPPGLNRTLQSQGQFLSCGTCGEQSPLVLQPDVESSAYFGYSVDGKGFGELESGGTPGECFNIADATCKAGQAVYMHACQGTDARVHKGNHFHFNATTKRIVSELCPGLCVASSTTGSQLQPCSDAGTGGWTFA